MGWALVVAAVGCCVTWFCSGVDVAVTPAGVASAGRDDVSPAEDELVSALPNWLDCV